jgi:tetratricopeptide (TPR) repeat protein
MTVDPCASSRVQARFKVKDFTGSCLTIKQGGRSMIARFIQRLPSAAGPFRGALLDRAILWSAILLVVSIAAFGTYYYLGQQGSSPPTDQEIMQRQLSQYEQLVRDDPNNINDRLALAETYYGLKRYSDAITQYEAALAINDQSTLGQVGLGQAKLATGDLAGASESFQKVIDQSQNSDVAGELIQSAHYYLGKIALDQQEPDVAIQQLTEATTIEKSDSDAWYLMGTAYEQMGHLDDAVNALKQAVLFVPNFTEAYQKLALVYDEKGASAEALYARGMAAYSQGQLDEAVNQLQAAVNASPTLAEAYSGLGLVRESQGQPDAAMTAYQQALQLRPDDFNAVSGVARLNGSGSGASSGLPANHPTVQAGGSDQQGVTP